LATPPSIVKLRLSTVSAQAKVFSWEITDLRNDQRFLKSHVTQ